MDRVKSKRVNADFCVPVNNLKSTILPIKGDQNGNQKGVKILGTKNANREREAEQKRGGKNLEKKTKQREIGGENKK